MKACHSCGHPWTEQEAPGFSVTCERCGEFLHCCLNCKFHAPGMHNDCRESQADPVRDKAARNICEWFQFAESGSKGAAADSSASARARLEELFGPPRASSPGEAEEGET
jgi:hypothetical protein